MAMHSLQKPSRRRGGALSALASLAMLGALLAPVGADATWPGRSGAIVFDAYRLGGEADAEEGKGIWSSLPGVPFGQIQRLTSDPGDSEPQVSPDGRWIVFTRGVSPDPNGFPTAFAIFRMRSDGSALGQVTDGLHSDGQATFLRSGRRIVFARFAPEREDRDLYSVGLDGAGLHQVTSGRADDRNPAASPTGRAIAFERSSPPRGPGHYNHIFTARPSGADVHDITPRIPGNEEARSPDFNPRGNRIAFAMEGNVFTMTPSGNGARRVSGFSFPRSGLGEPAYSPDGRSILAVYGDRYRGSDLYLYDVRRRKIVPCVPVHLSLQLRAPAWRPASKQRGGCR